MRKSQRIAQLEAQLASEGAYLGLAKELHARVADRLSASDQADLNAAFALTLAETEDELVRKGIEAKLAALPPERLLGMYAMVLGDDSVNEPLKRLGLIRQKEAERQAKLAAISQEAAVSQQLDLHKIDEGEIITIGLFRPDMRSSLVSFEAAVAAGRQITARMRVQAEATLQVLHDTFNFTADSYGGGMKYAFDTSNLSSEKLKIANQRLEDHQLIQLGTLVRTGSAETFEPILTYGTEVALKVGSNRAHSLSYELGYVAIGDRPLLNRP